MLQSSLYSNEFFFILLQMIIVGLSLHNLLKKTAN